jgi:hypothetical protein
MYRLALRGWVDEEDLNEMSPLLLVREGGDTAVTHFRVHTDQSGLIGLMRHLHGLGYVFLSLSRDVDTDEFAEIPATNASTAA